MLYKTPINETPANQPVQFGFETVSHNQKSKKVDQVFNDVTPYYDWMNNLMSLGMHHQWKRQLIDSLAISPSDCVLDLATGTGDIAYNIHCITESNGYLVCLDINQNMLSSARDKLLNLGVSDKIHYLQADAQAIPVANESFDTVTMAFGLRNTTDIRLTLAECLRVLKPGGKLGVLEFSHPDNDRIKYLYHQYLLSVLPQLGHIAAGDRKSYQYLAESIIQHPTAIELKRQMITVGFNLVEIIPILSGTVAIHLGYKSYV
ncbi:MAG: bifunctional demethylmenaquinone methyltransferase/2-methoxy-6-polyprenyl-1,4-benzoquinol methylase UbiE [Legionellales bacterium]|nr:bifunctional demethylmenaquinone methyltransferase/2-methoxy-6-polyprenyl-1,4-benzoquinol methylase UbiE [Legionellales bacterium]